MSDDSHMMKCDLVVQGITPTEEMNFYKELRATDWFSGNIEDLIDGNGKVDLQMETSYDRRMEKYLDIICKYPIKGQVLLGSLYYSNEGDFWGWKFDGRGNVKKLKGKVMWEEDE